MDNFGDSLDLLEAEKQIQYKAMDKACGILTGSDRKVEKRLSRL